MAEHEELCNKSEITERAEKKSATQPIAEPSHVGNSLAPRCMSGGDQSSLNSLNYMDLSCLFNHLSLVFPLSDYRVSTVDIPASARFHPMNTIA